MPVDAASPSLPRVGATPGGPWAALVGTAPLQQRLGLRRPGRSHREEPGALAPLARSAFWLYASGSILVLLSLLFDGGPNRDGTALAALALTGLAVALVCLVGFDRLAERAYHALALAAVLLITLGLHYASYSNGYYRFLYVWVAIFAAYHFTPRATAVQVLAMGVGYGAVVAIDDVPAAPIVWLLAFSTLVVVAVITHMLKRRIAQQLREAQAQNERLRENDRLKDEFLANVSHELRTPLTSIRGYLDLALEDEELEIPPQVRGYLEVIDRNSERLLRQVTDLLLVAQIEARTVSIDRRPVDMQAVAESAVDRHVGAAAAHGIALTLETLPVATVTGDEPRLAQMLDVLLSNALKFTPAGGSVWVRLHGLPGELVELEVADSGVGVPAGQQERLFERFFRASGVSEQAVPGTGIGLTIARGIVEAHGGSIRCTSVEGAGTTFTVELPGQRPSRDAELRPATAGSRP